MLFFFFSRELLSLVQNPPIQAELNVYIKCVQRKQVRMVLAKGGMDICPENSLLGMLF